VCALILSIAAIQKNLALPKTSWQICLLAIIGGSTSALLVVLFTLTIAEIQQLYLLKRDEFNSLDSISRFDLPLIGAVIILLFVWLTGYKYRHTGIPFVLHRLKIAHGIIPIRNTLNQFWGSAVALASGFSVGREGPAVHLGAACSSYIADKLKLPYNSIRTLCACGIAAGIAATFNTPLAAVIFVMEVILREYKIHIFIPVMLAALVGSMITQHLLGTDHSFDYIQTVILNPAHYISLALLALFLGMLAAGFNKYLVLIIKYSKNLHIITRLLMAAFITGILGYWVPEAMGAGISAIDISFSSDWHIGLLISLLCAKFLMTIFALGLGIPGGVIGPVLAIGAITGACSGAVVTLIFPNESLGSSFVLMGMAGFMAASLNAPLAALLTVLELSNQLDLVLPAMMVITIASLISRQVFNNGSIFTMLLDVHGLLYRKAPIESVLEKVGGLAIMQEDFILLSASNKKDLAEKVAPYAKQALLINQMPEQRSTQQQKFGSNDSSCFYWVQSTEQYQHAANPVPQKNTGIDLSLDYLAYNRPLLAEVSQTQSVKEKANVDNITQTKLIGLSHQATLADAYFALVKQRCGGVYIYRQSKENIIGIITFEQLRVYLVEGKLT